MIDKDEHSRRLFFLLSLSLSLFAKESRSRKRGVFENYFDFSRAGSIHVCRRGKNIEKKNLIKNVKKND